MKYIECPEEYFGNEPSLFIAGGISNCPDWQKYFAELLKNEKIVLLNPRRTIFPKDNDEKQIDWEFRHLNKADAISFWFPKETICPITLYELGRSLMTGKHIFVGVHPEYSRKKDIEIQTRHIRPEIKVVYSLEDVAEQIKYWNSTI
jgi:hypothetical protein